MRPAIYLAGKVHGSGDWRCQILGRYAPRAAMVPTSGRALDPDCGDDSHYEHYKNFDLPVLFSATFEKHVAEAEWPVVMFEEGFAYTGPYYEDKWGGHGVDNDGMELSHATDEYEETRSLVYGACMKALAFTTHVFAWIDDFSAYGTLFEIGATTACWRNNECGRRLPVRVAFSEDAHMLGIPDDMWFMLRAPNVTADMESRTPVDAFSRFYRELVARWEHA